MKYNLQKTSSITKEQIRKIWSQVLIISESHIKFDNSFFSLGGNSLLAVKLINLINHELEIHLSVIDFLKSATINNQLVHIENCKSLSETKKRLTNGSPNQPTFSESLILRDYFSSQYKNIYNESIVVKINQAINEAKFEHIVEDFMESCDILRANYYADEGQFKRIIRGTNNSISSFVDLTRTKSTEDILKNHTSSLLQKEFNIENDTLIQFHLVKMCKDKYCIVVIYFHAILDGTSMVNILLPQFVKRLIDNNSSKTKLQQHKLSSINNLNQYLTSQYSENLDQKIIFWRTFLTKYDSCKIIDNITNDTTSHRGQQYSFEFDKDLTLQLSKLAVLYEVSIFDVLLSGFYLLLSKFSRQNNIAIRTNIDERIFSPDNENVLGCFTNNIFIGLNLQSDWTIKELFKSIKENKINSIKNTISYNSLLDMDREAVNALSEIHFNVVPQETEQYIHTQSQVYTNSEQVKNNLYFELDVKSDSILGRVEFKASLFTQESIKCLINTYKTILSHFNKYCDKQIFNIPAVSDKQKDELVKKSVGEKLEYNECTIHEMFENEAQLKPQDIAIINGNFSITYGELNNLSNQIANYLRLKYRVNKDDFVVVSADRNYLTFAAILAVLKLGAAYVPIDTSYPEKRIQYILDQTKATLFISELSYANKFTALITEAKSFFIDDKNILSSIKEQPIKNIKSTVSCDSLAYIIFTSGSTGNPKGVMVQHKSVINYIIWLYSYAEMSKQSIVDCSSSLSFDLTISTSIAPLCIGARMICCDNATKKDPLEYYKYLVSNKVSIVKLTPSYVSVLLPIVSDNGQLTDLQSVIIGGEAARKHDIREWLSHYPKHKFYNEYGPTEATIAVSQYMITIDNVESIDSYVPIGKPGQNNEIYILDAYGKLLPNGITGELYIGGAGVTKGYLNNVESNSKSFVVKPEISQSYLYKTGDLGRWNADNDLEYLGRIDNQVKIRGFRIELGEIENALLNYPGVKQVAVLAKSRLVSSNNEQNDKYLIVYYVADKTLNEDKMISYLQDLLPDYAVPEVLVYLSKLPLTINGKLDIRNLPDMSLKLGDSHIPARNALEQQLIDLWAELLGIETLKISISDNFFKLGGDSIVAIQFVSRIRKSCGFSISVKDIFKYPTIMRLSSYILSDNAVKILPEVNNKVLNGSEYLKYLNENSRIEGAYLANSLQQGFIYHSLSQENDDAYLVQMLWEYSNELNIDKYYEAWQLIQQSYPGLRLRFQWENDLVQIIDKESSVIWNYIDLSYEKNISKLQNLLDTYIAKDRSTGYKLKTGNLFRIYLFKLSETRYQLLFSNHHIILDGWSMPLLINSVHDVYLSLCEGNKANVEYDTAYAKSQAYLQEHENKDQTFWKNYISEVKDHTDLSGLMLLDKQHIQLNEYKYVANQKILKLNIDQELYIKLKDFSRTYGITISVIIQFCLHKAMSIYS
ncbi:MAG: hypothetical protein K0R94_871, partial [Burkholderiales bacterium]|nr:hypothetical protein [Burkholderiales bacterium]